MKKSLITAASLTALTILFTLLVMLVDVKAIGPRDSAVGLAALNGPVHEAVKTNLFWYDVSKVMGMIGMMAGGVIALMGLFQWIKGKSLRKVDPAIFAAGGLYVLLVVLWKAFDKIVINYRPILENGQLEASYPSTHSMLAVVFFGSALFFVGRYVFPEGPKRMLMACLALAGGLTIMARFLSGVHWLTDIIGGLLFGLMLLSWFKCSADWIEQKRDWR